MVDNGMSCNDKDIFKSKIDKRTIIGLFVLISPYLFLLCYIFINKFFGVIEILGLIISILAIYGNFYCRYIFQKDFLSIKFGFFTYYKIPYKEIESFYETDMEHFIVSPAMSKDRIRINYGEEECGVRKFVLVSPRDKSLFKKILSERIILSKKN